MAVTTKTQKEQTQKKIETPGTEKTTPGEQSLRDELREDSQQFFRTLLRMGVRLSLAPVYLLASRTQEAFCKCRARIHSWVHFARTRAYRHS